MRSQERETIAARLGGAVSAGASSQEVAALVTTTFRGIDQALTPIVGSRGLAALYQRSLHLARQQHRWLPETLDGGVDAVDLRELGTALAKRSAAEAGACGANLLDIFCALLATLIGESLSERLLRAVWANFLSGFSPGDTKS